ncbi:serine/threonine-protein kinase STY13 [Balamuthia mandrillaris]
MEKGGAAWLSESESEGSDQEIIAQPKALPSREQQDGASSGEAGGAAVAASHQKTSTGKKKKKASTSTKKKDAVAESGSGSGKKTKKKKKKKSSGTNKASKRNRWELRSEEIRLGTRLGQGAFGVVHQGTLRGQQVAIKRLTKQNMSEASLTSFRREMRIMSKLRQPHLLLFMGACTEPGKLMIVTEFMAKGSVQDLLHNPQVELTFKRRMLMAKQAALGMNWLHCLDPPIIHRANLLVDQNWTVKVADFGLCRFDEGESEETKDSVGTPLWMAPEILLGKPYDSSADVYSFGIVLWELLTREQPFAGVTSIEALKKAVCDDSVRPTIPKSCPIALRDLIEACWRSEPGKRPTFQQMLPKFDEIIIQAVISDLAGQRLWTTHFLELLKVPWLEFVGGFCAFLHMRPPNEGTDVRFACLKSIVAYPLAPEPEKKNLVKMEDFANMLCWFGPLEEGKDGVAILQRITTLLAQPWFFGFFSAAEAERALNKQRKGTFLIRFSSKEPGSYSISVLDASARSKLAVKHYRVSHSPGTGYTIGNIECKSLEDIVTRYHKELGLKVSCPGSPYLSLFQKTEPEAGLQQMGYLVPQLP